MTTTTTDKLFGDRLHDGNEVLYVWETMESDLVSKYERMLKLD